MRIAYVCHWNPFVEDGVVRKIRSQTNAWRRFGADVEVFCLSSDSASDARTPPLQGRHFLYGDPYAGRARATVRLCRAVGRWRPDVVYLRYSLFLPPPVQLMRAAPTVIEINSDDRVEYRHRSRALGVLQRLQQARPVQRGERACLHHPGAREPRGSGRYAVGDSPHHERDQP